MEKVQGGDYENVGFKDYQTQQVDLTILGYESEVQTRSNEKLMSELHKH